MPIIRSRDSPCVIRQPSARRTCLLVISVCLSSGLPLLPVDVSADRVPDSLAYQMPLTLVTASRYPQPASSVSAGTVVLTRDQIRDLPVRNVLEAVNYVTGFTVRRTGGFATRELIAIQGSEHRHVTVLLDGIPLNNVTEGLADLVQLPLEIADRVEIVKGPASSTWGSALGGVIQVLTPDPASDPYRGITAGAGYGRWGTQQEHASVSDRAGRVAYFLAASRATTDGFRPKSAHDGVQLYSKLQWALPGATAMLALARLDGDTEDFQLSGQPAWKRHRYGTAFAQAAYSTCVRQVDIQGHAFAVDRSDEVEFLSPGDDAVLNAATFDEPAFGASLQAVGRLRDSSTLSAGLDLRQTRADFRFQGGPAERTYHQAGAFATWSCQVGRLRIDSGLRADDHSMYGSQLSPSAGLVFSLPAARSLVRAHVARGFGAPPLSAAFLPETATSAPNPDLQAEHGVGYAIGLETRPLPGSLASIAWFRNDTDNAIESTVNQDGKFVRRNLDRHRRQGVELQARWLTGFGLSLAGGAAFNRSRNRSADAVISGTPRQTRDLTIAFARVGLGKLLLAGHYADYRIDPVLARAPTSFTSEDGKFIWDLRLSRGLHIPRGVRIQAYLDLRNLLNDRFWWLTPYPLPGRSIHVGLSGWVPFSGSAAP